MKIYVDLPDKLAAVWCPVEAIPIQGGIHQIIEVNRYSEEARRLFATGARVNLLATLCQR